MTLPHEEDFIRAGGQFEDVHDRSLVYVEMILEQGRRLTHLYKLEYKAYHSHRASQCSERSASKFSTDGRIFLAGDALHINSPKAGIGMYFNF